MSGTRTRDSDYWTYHELGQLGAVLWGGDDSFQGIQSGNITHPQALHATTPESYVPFYSFYPSNPLPTVTEHVYLE